MNSEEFVQAIKEVVAQAAVKGTIENLERPGGRRPHQELVDLSNWYNNLSREDQENLRACLAMAVSNTIFSFLVVLDGMKRISDEDDDWRFELYYVNDDGVRTLLNDPDKEFLHDTYNPHVR